MTEAAWTQPPNVMTINGVPATVTRAQVVALIESLGLDPRELKHLDIGMTQIRATVAARRPTGREYLNDFETNSLARHELTIPIIDPPREQETRTDA